MRLQNFKAGTPVTIIASRGSGSLRTETSIVATDWYSCLVNAVRAKGMLLSFSGDIVIRAKVYDYRSDRDIVYPIKRVQLVHDDELGHLHRLYPGEMSAESSYRDCERVSCKIPAKIRVGRMRVVEDCVIRDVSHSGIGILAPSRMESAEIGSYVKISFKDPGTPKHLEVTARLVRVADMYDSNQVLLGCQLYEKQVSICVLTDMLKNVPMRANF